MVRILFVVSRKDPHHFEALTQTFDSEHDVEVVYDRRESQSSETLGQERRRYRPEVDTQIRVQGWAAVRIGPELAPPARITGHAGNNAGVAGL
jgi:hypothetical protein